MIARLSPLFPRGPYNFSRWLRPLHGDGSVPDMPVWRWIHTPGHTHFTQDWAAARGSVAILAALEPDVALTGHGRPMPGAQLRGALHELAENFDIVAVPGRGTYVDRPATVKDGSAYDGT